MGDTRKIVAATVGLALLWPLLQIATYGSFDALLAVGPIGTGRAGVEADIPDLVITTPHGHDGPQFYVMSRHPFDPQAAEGDVDPLAYRYRRIVYPLVATVLAPTGGRWVIAVFLLESLVGVAIGAWALSRLPGAPWWLPLTMAFTPGVIVALALSLSDALAAGLGLLAVAMALERRWLPMLVALTVAGLTRETVLLVAAGLVFTPGMPRRTRAATIAMPTLTFVAWAAWSSNAASMPVSDGGSDVLALPFSGWLTPNVPPAQRLLLLATFALMLAGAWRGRRSFPQVAATLALGAVLLASISELVAFNWINAMRPIAPMVPLAIWMLASPDRPEVAADP